MNIAKNSNDSVSYNLLTKEIKATGNLSRMIGSAAIGCAFLTAADQVKTPFIKGTLVIGGLFFVCDAIIIAVNS